MFAVVGNRRLAPSEAKLEAKLFCLEVGRGQDVADQQTRVMLFAVCFATAGVVIKPLCNSYLTDQSQQGYRPHDNRHQGKGYFEVADGPHLTWQALSRQH